MKEDKKKNKVMEIRIESLNLGTIEVPIKGITPLLMAKMSDEVKQQILAKQSGMTKSGKKKVRDTKQETMEAIHYTNKGEVGFPSHGFKSGMMDCTSLVGDKFFSKKLVQGLQIINVEEGLIPIQSKKQDVLVHSVGSNTLFNPQFHNWTCKLRIRYDKNNLGGEDIIRLLNYAGFYVGVGMWRPKGKDGGTGTYGMYEVDSKRLK